jgi:hypothetical protein
MELLSDRDHVASRIPFRADGALVVRQLYLSGAVVSWNLFCGTEQIPDYGATVAEGWKAWTGSPFE